MSLPARQHSNPSPPVLVALPPQAPDALAAFTARAEAAGLALTEHLSAGTLRVDLERYAAEVDGDLIELSPRQIELLAVFVAAPHRVWSREQLHWICWGDAATSRRVDVQLCRIRSKVGADIFRNVRDRGWILQRD